MKTFAVLVLCMIPMLSSAERPYGTAGKLPDAFAKDFSSAWPVASDEYDRPPVLLAAYKPIYPISRALSYVTGNCVVVFDIGVSGTAEAVRIERSDDDKMCDHAIIALRQWKFEPARKERKPVAVTVRVPFDFAAR